MLPMLIYGGLDETLLKKKICSLCPTHLYTVVTIPL